MRKKDRYKLINYAMKQYNEIFNLNLQYKELTTRQVEKLLKENKHSCMCEWSYCCYGLYTNCWQDPIEDGVWGLTQEVVDRIILNTFKRVRKHLKRDRRIGYYEDERGTHVVIVARDLPKDRCDYLITFTDKEYYNE